MLINFPPPEQSSIKILSTTFFRGLEDLEEVKGNVDNMGLIFTDTSVDERTIAGFTDAKVINVDVTTAALVNGGSND